MQVPLKWRNSTKSDQFLEEQLENEGGGAIWGNWLHLGVRRRRAGRLATTLALPVLASTC